MTAERIRILNERFGFAAGATPGWDDYTEEGKEDARSEARAALAALQQGQ